MHLQIVLTLGNSPATECVSLIAERTREDREGDLWPRGKMCGFLEDMGIKPCFVYRAEPVVQCSGSGERKCGMRLVASVLRVRGSALGYTHCAIR